MEELLKWLPLIATVISIGCAAFAGYVTIRIAPLLLRIQALDLSLQRVDKDREEEDKRLAVAIQENKTAVGNAAVDSDLKELKRVVQGLSTKVSEADFKELKSVVDSLDKNFPNCTARHEKLVMLIEAAEKRIRLELIQKHAELAEANAKFREQSAGITQICVSRDYLDKRLATEHADVHDRLRRIEDRLDKSRY